MEKFDVLDEQGNPTGEVKARAQVHQDGDWHRTVHVWLLNEKGELLLQLRGPHQEANPNCWDISCAGHLDAGEQRDDAAQRELREELGVSLSAHRFRHLFTCQSEFFDEGLIDREFSEIYLVDWKETDGDFALCPKEVSEVKWVHWKDLQKEVLHKNPEFVDHDREYQLLFELLNEKNTSC